MASGILPGIAVSGTNTRHHYHTIVTSGEAGGGDGGGSGGGSSNSQPASQRQPGATRTSLLSSLLRATAASRSGERFAYSLNTRGAYI